MPFFDKKVCQNECFYVKPVKICWRLGATPPDPLGLWRLRVSPPRRHARGAAFWISFIKYFFLIILNNHFFAYRLLAHRKSSYCVAPCPGAKLRKWARHLVYASMYFSEYNKDLISMFIGSQLRTVCFFVFASFDSPCPPPFGNVIRC